MSRTNLSPVAPVGRRRALADAVVEGLLVLPWWYAMDVLAHLRLSVPVFLVTWLGGWMLPRLATACWCPGGRLAGRLAGRAVEWLVPGLLLWALHPHLRRPLTPGEVAYALGSVGTLIEIWRFSLARAAAIGIHPVAEGLRRLVVIAGCLWPTWGYMTRLLVGGTDAKWYAYMLADFTTQSRAGVFPVFLGQSEWAWSGPIHPFRSAPLFLWAGGALDWLTAGALAPFSLQHLVALAATITGAFLVYGTACWLAPQHRWPAAGLAIVYACCPGLLQSISSADAFMTYMAIAVLPVVLLGNLQTLVPNPKAVDYLPLAAGVSLVWVAHPPVAYQASIASLVLQVGMLLFGPDPVRRLRSMVAGAACCGILSLYYFYSMSETGVSRPFARDAVLILSLAAAWGGVRALVAGDRRLALALLPVSGWMLWWIQPAWGWWWLGFVPLGTTLGWFVQRYRASENRHHGFEGIWLGCLLAMIPAFWMLGPDLPGHNPPALALLREYGRQWQDFLLPLSPVAGRVTDWQPGLSLLLLAGTGVVLAVRTGTLGAKLVAATAIVACLHLIRVPLISDFLVGYALDGMLQLASVPLMLRTLPVIACLLVGTAIIALANLRGPRAALALGMAVGLAAVWSAFEARQLVARQRHQTLPTRSSEWALHSENAVLYRFVYDLLPIPPYYSEGKIDARLEQRLLNAKRQVTFGPDEAARISEAHGAERLVLTSQPDPQNVSSWLKIEPGITVPPGGRLLLRFEFEPETYAGQLLFFGNLGSYREYALPVSGGALAFGTAPAASKIISLWNTDIAPETYHLSFRRAQEHTAGVASGAFATVTISRPDDSALPVQVQSWVPYRARLSLAEAGYLESSRVFFPGYTATVDGRPVPIAASPRNLLTVPVPAGEHTVEIRFAGTWPLWICAFVSGAAWSALAVGGLLRQTVRGQAWLERRLEEIRLWASRRLTAWRQAAGTNDESAVVWRRLGGIAVAAAIGLRLALVMYPLRDPWWSAMAWPIPLYFGGSMILVLLTWRLVAALTGSERTSVMAVLVFASANQFLYYVRHPFPFDWSLGLVLAGMLVAARAGSPLAAAAGGTFAAMSSLPYEGYQWAAAVFVVAGIVLGAIRRGDPASRLARQLGAGLCPILIVLLLPSFGLWSRSAWSPPGPVAWRWDLQTEFLRLSEGRLLLVWCGGAALAAYSVISHIGPIWLRTWGVATGVLGLGIYLLAGAFPIHATQGDVIRPLVWLVCVMTAWSLDCIWRHGPAGRATVAAILLLSGALAASGIARHFTAVTPEQFSRLAGEKVAELRQQGTGGIFRIELQTRGNGTVQPWSLEDTGLEAETLPSQPPYWQVLRLVRTATGDRGDSRSEVVLPDPWPGAVRLSLQLPEKSAVSEPLITTGVTGRGDFLYLLRDSAQTVRLGFDHWGVSGKVSPPISVDPTKPLMIEASLGSLYPEGAAADRRGRLLVRVNGVTVWSEPAEFHPSPLGTVRFGANPIGGSTTSEIFSGDILQMHFLTPDEQDAFFSAP